MCFAIRKDVNDKSFLSFPACIEKWFGQCLGSCCYKVDTNQSCFIPFYYSLYLRWALAIAMQGISDCWRNVPKRLAPLTVAGFGDCTCLLGGGESICMGSSFNGCEEDNGWEAGLKNEDPVDK